MKSIKYLFLSTIAILVVASCGTDYDVANDFTLTELPGYVAFNAPGNSTTLSDVSVSEDAGSTSFNIENPTGTTSDITVNYSLGGTAVYGVDYTIDGASAAGGSVVIQAKTSADAQGNRNSVDLNINILEDGVFDETKEIIVTLESASSGEGDVAVGRGGTDLLKSAKVLIANIDCGFTDISGGFSYVTTDYFCGGDPISGNSSLTQVSEGVFTFEDWGFGSYEACYGGSAANWGTLQLNFCSNVVSVSGIDNYGDPWTFNIVSVDGPNLTVMFENPYPEFATSVLTRDDGNDWPPLTN